jgi:UTP-glucose-1-phosphate uridylyltransferase
MTDLKRKVSFINGSSQYGLGEAVLEMLRRKGPSWLTEEQMAELIAQKIAEERSSQRMQRRSREISAKVIAQGEMGSAGR